MADTISKPEPDNEYGYSQEVVNALTTERDRLNCEVAALVDLLAGLVSQHCPAESGVLDSLALSVNSDAMRELARRGRLVIDSEYGRRVLGHWA